MVFPRLTKKCTAAKIFCYKNCGCIGKYWMACYLATFCLLYYIIMPNPDLIQRLARKGFWGNGWAMSCGGSFQSSWWERSHAAFSFVMHFFYHPNLAIWTKCSIYGALFIVLTIILKKCDFAAVYRFGQSKCIAYSQISNCSPMMMLWIFNFWF